MSREPYTCTGCGIPLEQGERCDSCEAERLRHEVVEGNKRQIVLQRENAAMRALLRELEWGTYNREDEPSCPSCRAEAHPLVWDGRRYTPGPDRVHEPDCKLGALLARFPEEAPRG